MLEDTSDGGMLLLASQELQLPLFTPLGQKMETLLPPRENRTALVTTFFAVLVGGWLGLFRAIFFGLIL